MMLHTVSQLLDPEQIAPEQLDAALLCCAPFAIKAGAAAGSPIGAAGLPAAVLAALPAALNVSVSESICYRWWPGQSVKTPLSFTTSIEWVLRPRLEWLSRGLVAVTVPLEVTLRLDKDPWTVRHEPTSSLLSLGMDGWCAVLLTLAIASTAGTTPAQVFHERRTKAFIDCGPWHV